MVLMSVSRYTEIVDENQSSRAKNVTSAPLHRRHKACFPRACSRARAVLKSWTKCDVNFVSGFSAEVYASTTVPLHSNRRNMLQNQ